MTLVILQPAGSQGAREHYTATIESFVPLTKCRDLLPAATYLNLKTLHTSAKAGMWGVTAGKSNVNVKKWERVAQGDLVLFTFDKKIRSSAVVATKFHSKKLAKALWGLDADGKTWEYMYSLDEIRNLDISYKEFNRTVGYKENNIVQGFTVLDETKSGLFLDHFSLRSERYSHDVSDEEYEKAEKGIGGELDRKVMSWYRAEQSRGRKRLLKNEIEGVCLLCGRKMLAEFLIAAHIKKRAECTDDQKRDLAGVLMLACKFGCDYLFEVGAIALDERHRLTVSDKLMDLTALTYVGPLRNGKVSVTTSQSGYFEWHLKNRFLK